MGLNSTVLIVQTNKEQMNGKFLCLCEADSRLLSWKCSQELFFFHAMVCVAAVKSFFYESEVSESRSG